MKYFPPTLIQAGADEVLLDDSRRMAAKFKVAGVSIVREDAQPVTTYWHSLWHK